jgi:AAA ATPase domain
LLLGDAGIGKTSLIDAAADSSREAGMQVLRARAVEAERELPFAGLAELLAPVAARVEELAPEHAAALAAARPCRSRAAGPSPPNRCSTPPTLPADRPHVPLPRRVLPADRQGRRTR